MKVFGKFGRASFFCFAVRKVMGLGLMELVDGATRYARPCRPVKPLLMIWDESAKSERQRAQRRWDVAPVRYESGDVGGEEVDEMEFERALSTVEVLDWRLRKGREGIR